MNRYLSFVLVDLVMTTFQPDVTVVNNISTQQPDNGLATMVTITSTDEVIVQPVTVVSSAHLTTVDQLPPGQTLAEAGINKVVILFIIVC